MNRTIIINEVENFCALQCWRNTVYIEERKSGIRWLCRRRVMWGTKNNIIRKLGSGRVASQI